MSNLLEFRGHLIKIGDSKDVWLVLLGQFGLVSFFWLLWFGHFRLVALVWLVGFGWLG